MSKFFTLLFFLLVAISSKAQIDSISPILEISCPDVRFFTTDRLQNIYTVDKSNLVKKYNPQGSVQFEFNNNRLGTLAHIDATDPFNLLLFYPDYRTVFTLDRTLSHTGEFNLQDLDIIDISAIGMSSDNNLWLYDDINFNLKKIDRNGKTLISGSNLNLIIEQEIRPNFILERQQRVFLNAPEIGIIVFDIFGNFVKTLPIQNLDKFQVINDVLIYKKDNTINTLNLSSFLYQELDTLQPTESLRIEKDRIYIKSDLSLKVYNLKKD